MLATVSCLSCAFSGKQAHFLGRRSTQWSWISCKAQAPSFPQEMLRRRIFPCGSSQKREDNSSRRRVPCRGRKIHDCVAVRHDYCFQSLPTPLARLPLIPVVNIFLSIKTRYIRWPVSHRRRLTTATTGFVYFLICPAPQQHIPVGFLHRPFCDLVCTVPVVSRLS